MEVSVKRVGKVWARGSDVGENAVMRVSVVVCRYKVCGEWLCAVNPVKGRELAPVADIPAGAAKLSCPSLKASLSRSESRCAMPPLSGVLSSRVSGQTSQFTPVEFLWRGSGGVSCLKHRGR